MSFYYILIPKGSLTSSEMRILEFMVVIIKILFTSKFQLIQEKDLSMHSMHHWGDVSCVTVRYQLRCQPPVPGQC